MNVRLLLALHFHQPVGNFDGVFREAVRLCYLPILEHFERHPEVKAAVHYSGCLLEWLEQNDPSYLDRLIARVGTGQLEPLGGGFYEPILTVIPKEDALEQLDRLNAYWKKRSGIVPAGAWLTERVWEPSLAETLAEAGIRYTVLDDHHLRLSGLLTERFTGLYATERAGRPLAFFPSDFHLRYLIPFRTVPVVREHFERFASGEGERVLTYGDDAEKFGFWPGTHKWVFEEGWLEQFFTLLEDPASPVHAQAPGTYLASGPASRKVYVPNASYPEMLEWALPASSVAGYARTRAAAAREVPAENVRAFVRGSLWDMFFARYPESDEMHKHALWTSRRTREAAGSGAGMEKARTSALRAQCNCAYWHGLFGGVYFPHLRQGVYRNLLEADAALAERERGLPRAEVEDLDGDFQPEILLRSKLVQAFFRPADAGTLFELDYLPARFNVANVVSRWKESYHEGADLTHEHAVREGIGSPHERSVGVDSEELREAAFDSFPLRSLRDFTAAENPTPERLRRFEGMSPARGRPLAFEISAKGWAGEFSLEGVRYRRGVRFAADDVLEVSWEFSEKGRFPLFGTLLALTLLAGDAPDRRLRLQSEGGSEERFAPREPRAAARVTRVSLEDGFFGFAMDADSETPMHVTAAPIETLQRSEEKYEKGYQGTLLALAWPNPGRNLTLRLSFRSIAGGVEDV